LGPGASWHAGEFLNNILLVRLFSVSGACSRSGKTACAVSLLEALPRGASAAVKFTTTEDVFEKCPRGTPCVVCDIDVPFRIIEEGAVLTEAGTDTDRLGRAGARRVLWVIAKQQAAEAAWRAVRARLEGEAVVVMEGSTVVSLARPETNVFVVHPFLSPERWKPTSEGLLATADLVVVNRPAAETRPPAAEVVAAIERHRQGRGFVVADVTRPAPEWAGPLLQDALRLPA
jgi:hypothetical protein